MSKYLLIASSALLPACAAAELKVVASFSILGDFATQVGGDLIDVETIVGPGQDTHVYSPSVADVRLVANADLVIINGLEFEQFIEDLVSASGTKAPVLTASDNLALRLDGDDDHDDHDDHDMKDDHDEHDDHDDHDEAGHDDPGHHHGEEDPHAWNAIANVVTYVQAIEEGLSDLDPTNATIYAANAEAYIETLQDLQDGYAARIAALPTDHRTIVTSHDAFGYLAAETGLTFLAPRGLSTLSAASSGQVLGLIEQLQALPHAAVFVQGVDNPALVAQIAEETGYTLGGSLYSDALTPADGPAPTYVDLYKHNLESILDALEAN